MAKVPPIATLANMGFRVLLCNWLIVLLTFGAVSAAGPASKETSQPLRIVVFGDSLVAGFGIKPSDAFPAQLERALKAKGHAVEVTNAGVSGDTTAGGLERVAWAVPESTNAVILELGANDALRGLDPARAKANLDGIIGKIKASGAEILLAGMMAPRNLGRDYVRAFDAIYPDLATKHGLILYPFFLDGVAMDGKLNLDDGLHPNGRGVAEITRRIMPAVEQLIERARAKQAAATKG
jgi:acyl-CoA thioesterase-1